MEPLVEVIVGVIGRAHGVRGAVRVELRTDEPTRRFAPGAIVRAETGEQQYTVDSARWHSQNFLVQFRELTDRAAAQAAAGTVLVSDVAADETPAAAGEFYDRQLIGLRVEAESGRVVGVVSGVLHPAGQDLLEVDTGAEVRLVPFVTQLVPVVDLAAGFIRVAEVPGLLTDAVSQ